MLRSDYVTRRSQAATCRTIIAVGPTHRGSSLDTHLSAGDTSLEGTIGASDGHHVNLMRDVNEGGSDGDLETMDVNDNFPESASY